MTAEGSIFGPDDVVAFSPDRDRSRGDLSIPTNQGLAALYSLLHPNELAVCVWVRLRPLVRAHGGEPFSGVLYEGENNLQIFLRRRVFSTGDTQHECHGSVYGLNPSWSPR